MKVGGDGSVESGKWPQICMSNKLFFFFHFSTQLLSFTALPYGNDGTTYWFGIAANLDVTEMPVVQLYFRLACNVRKIHRLQIDSVIIIPQDMDCFSISFKPWI